ncbi:MAG: hypothetical protein IAG10_06970 [Planctomycetaceae bacterium]|nr:hypothetical protein [Planctomycetaceae bacterium]
MPTTVNGVGTHYYGKQDESSRRGTCQHCGTEGQLQSYTTRLWFVIVFIPVIPLKRVRLLDYCPRCQRHWVANPEQFEMSRQLAVSGAMEKYRDQPSVEAALVVHAQLLSFHMHPDADKFRESVLEQYADSAELRAGLAAHLDQTGRWTEATPLYEKAFELKPDLPEVRNSLAWRRVNENKLDEAYELLDFLRQPGAGLTFNLGPLETLALSYQKLSRHERVIEICEHLLREVPAAGEKHEFRKLVTKSERALHRSTSLLPEKSFSIRGLFDSKSGTHAPWVRWAAFGAVAAFLFALGMAGLNEYRRTHRTLHVVNAFAQPVSVSIDGGPAISVAQRTPIPISEGKHRINLTGPVTKQAEIALQSGYWSRWTNSPIWVFNVEKVSAVFVSTLHYAAVPQPTENVWLEGDPNLSFVPHVDYVFEEPPQTMRVEGKNKTVTKIHVGVMPTPPATVSLGLLSAPDQSVALTFAEGHLERNPKDASLLNVYATRPQGDANERRVFEFLKAGLWRKPISVPWHRAYQHQKSVIENEAALAAEYDTHLQQDPNDDALLYLRGRVGTTRADQLKHFQLANEKGPQSGWPAMALAYDAANRGQWQEAKQWCDKAVNVLRADPSFRNLWHIVRMANGEAGAMEAEYRQQMAGQDYLEMLAAVSHLADVLAAQQKHDEARQTIRQWFAKMAGPNTPAEALSPFDLMLDYVCGNVDGFRQNRDKLSSQSPSQLQLQFLLAIGDPDSAVKIEGLDKLTNEWPALLGISLSYSLAGNSTEAEAWLTRACDKMREANGELKRGAALLQRERAPTDDELDEIVLRVTETPLFLAALAQRFPDRKAKLNQRAELLNISRQPPYLLVKQAVEQP